MKSTSTRSSSSACKTTIWHLLRSSDCAHHGPL